MTLLYGVKDDLFKWASLRIFGTEDDFQDAQQAIGVVFEGSIIASVIYSDYQPGLLIEMSIASVDKRWATKHNLNAFFHYPFIQLGLERVQTLCSAKDEGVIMFNKKLGFTPEGYHRKAWHAGGDAISWSMLKPECKWI